MSLQAIGLDPPFSVLMIMMMVMVMTMATAMMVITEYI